MNRFFAQLRKLFTKKEVSEQKSKVQIKLGESEKKALAELNHSTASGEQFIIHKQNKIRNVKLIYFNESDSLLKQHVWAHPHSSFLHSHYNRIQKETTHQTKQPQRLLNLEQQVVSAVSRRKQSNSNQTPSKNNINLSTFSHESRS
ncbi:hypothetical protein E1H99_06555 [Enterococcus hirae]|nr:hypothetical protein E1H99_06555 [Enterococcus hirae]